MSGTASNRRRGERGQALVEQSILLAIMGGLRSLANLGDTIMQQPPAVLFVGALVAVAVVYVWMSGRT
jgi:hypothetical protein